MERWDIFAGTSFGSAFWIALLLFGTHGGVVL